VIPDDSDELAELSFGVYSFSDLVVSGQAIAPVRENGPLRSRDDHVLQLVSNKYGEKEACADS
jgi:hypothetical protein